MPPAAPRLQAIAIRPLTKSFQRARRNVRQRDDSRAR
jgi:hypothetical protein